MEIIYQPKFVCAFKQIWDYISQDSKNRANDFKSEVKKKIEDLVFMPLKYKKSIYFEDDNIRDLIFKGYTIVYKIDNIHNKLIIIGITKYKNSL